MQIRRPVAALLTALALFGGGATLTACSENSKTGVPAPGTETSGVPDNSNRQTSDAPSGSDDGGGTGNG
jgi:hypothetical protein